MRNIWFTSDTHFFHENMLNWGRDFSSVEEMNETIVDRWNSVVKPGDKVYHLGDVFLGPSTHEERAKLWSRLAGSKRLIVGNHDDIKYLSKGNFFSKIYLFRVWHDKPLIFSHVPMHPDSIVERVNMDNAINVHGHTHYNGSPEGPYKSVCTELTNYTPVNLEELYSG